MKTEPFPLTECKEIVRHFTCGSKCFKSISGPNIYLSSGFIFSLTKITFNLKLPPSHPPIYSVYGDLLIINVSKYVTHIIYTLGSWQWHFGFDGFKHPIICLRMCERSLIRINEICINANGFGVYQIDMKHLIGAASLIVLPGINGGGSVYCQYAIITNTCV